MAAKKGFIIGGQYTYQGDSGGPLWVEEDGRAVLIGIMSRGHQNSPVIYTRSVQPLSSHIESDRLIFIN